MFTTTLLGSAPAGGPSPPPPYVAKAVHFDGATQLSTASLASTDNTDLSWVFWAKCAPSNDNIFFVSDSDNNYLPLVGGSLASNLSGTVGNIANTGTQNFTTAGSLFPNDTWVCVIGSIDSTVAGRGRLYFGDTEIALNLVTVRNGFPFNIEMNGLTLNVMGDTFGSFLAGDIADFRLMPGTSLLNGSFVIPLATRRLFIDGSGKPVDPATATTALGTPCILFSGDHATFPANQGTGGAFTLTGALTNASTSPSD